MNCNCCGVEIDRVLVNVFLPDDSDKEALIQFSDNGKETYCLETDQNWTGCLISTNQFFLFFGDKGEASSRRRVKNES